jgi:multicomponent Na+:H+ antiporter subunit D
MTLAAVTLVALAGRRAALRAAMRYLLAALLGSLLYLLGMALLYGTQGVLDLTGIAHYLEANLTTLLGVTFITLGLLLKGAIFPLHFWLPAAHGYAPIPVSAILSAVVVAASFYLLLRLWFGPFALLLNPSAATLLGLLGAAAILWGALQALQQQRIKMVIAYSTVSQLGYGLLAFPLIQGGVAPKLAWAGALLLIFAHGLAKAALFFASGCIAYHFGHDRIRDIVGAPAPLVWAWLAFALAAASLIGLPPSGGFAGKWLLLQAAIANQSWGWAIIIIAGSVLAAGYLFRVLGRALHPVRPPAPPELSLPPSMLIMSLSLGFAAFFLGFWMTPLMELVMISGDAVATATIR